MALDPIPPTTFEFIQRVEQAYSCLMHTAGRGNGEELGLGGKLLFAGELDEARRALIVAGNIAGAASLAATSDPEAQKRAVRDGVVDFLVTSLDEALRILKNEIRKRETVAVCVAAAPEAVDLEMQERGILPDLLAPGLTGRFAEPGHNRREPFVLGLTAEAEGDVLVAWRVAAMPAQWLPKLDAVALECLDGGQEVERRWLRLAPRYLGRLAQGVRLLRCDEAVATNLLDRVRERVTGGEIAIGVEMQVCTRGELRVHLLSPPAVAPITS